MNESRIYDLETRVFDKKGPSMIRNSILLLVFAVSSLLAALGSGPFIRTGIGLSGLYGTDLSLDLRHFTISLETGLRWTTLRHTKSPKWKL